MRHPERRRPEAWETQSGKKVINSNIAFEEIIWEQAHALARKNRMSFTKLVNRAVAHFVQYADIKRND